MKFKANLVEKPGNFQMDDCLIEKVVELTHEEFCKLKITPMEKQPFITENKSCMYSKDGVLHCLLALGPNSNDGILIEAAGYDYPRLAAYIPGMRDIVNAEMARAADYIIRQGAENAGGCRVSFEELEERLGLTIRDGNGLDAMLRSALERRAGPVEMRDGCVEMTGRGAALGHDPETPLSHRAVSLIATYEEMYRVPEARRVTYYFGDYGGHFLKYGTAEAAALTAYDKALAAIQMDDGAFRQAAEFNYRGGIIARMWRCMLGEDAHLQKALDICPDRQNAVLLHEDAPDRPVSVEHLARLTQSGQEDFSALLGAQVREIRAGESAAEVVVSGVEPQELERLEEAYDALTEAGPSMGLMM